MTWLKNKWLWIVGSPVILGLLALLSRLLRRPDPIPTVPAITKDEVKEKHEAIEDEKKEVFDHIDTQIDTELDHVLKKFGG